MAKGKYRKWLEPAQLERVTNWALKGCTNKEIAANIGVREQTLYDWVNRFPEFSDALKKGREMCVECLENMAFKVAMGLAEEEHVVKLREPGGRERAEIVSRRMPPNPAMLMFLLKNRAGYRSEPETSVRVDVAPTVVLGIEPKRDG